MEALDALQPFGTGNTVPLVILEGLRLSEIRILKDVHLTLVLTDGARKIDGMLFNGVDTPFGKKIEEVKGCRIDVLGNPSINVWQNNKSLQVMVEDVRLSTAELPLTGAC